MLKCIAGAANLDKKSRKEFEREKLLKLGAKVCIPSLPQARAASSMSRRSRAGDAKGEDSLPNSDWEGEDVSGANSKTARPCQFPHSLLTHVRH